MPSLLRNCRLGEGCHKTWDSLVGTGETDVRYCSACREKVYKVDSEKELWSNLKLGRCVALLVADNRRGHFLGDMSYALNETTSLLKWE